MNEMWLGGIDVVQGSFENLDGSPVLIDASLWGAGAKYYECTTVKDASGQATIDVHSCGQTELPAICFKPNGLNFYLRINRD